VRCLPFGVDKELFSPGARSLGWRAEAQEGRGEVPIFLAMGRLSGEKHWPVVLEGFMRAFPENQALLLVFGDGPERGRLESLVEGRKDIRFMGFEPDRHKVATALASADVLVHGCPFETFGLTIAQAIASGLPLVVPDRGGAAELAHTSFSEVYRADDPEACARALSRVMARGPMLLRQEAILRRDRVFGAEDQVEKTVQVYRELLRARRPGCARWEAA
jgi:alpha-1,6-mannosyltransferase